MDALCLKAGLMTSPITVADVRTNPSLVTTAVGRSLGNVISAEKPRRTSPRGFSIRYPLRSLWRENQNRFDAIALDDAVSVDETEDTKLGLVDGQNGNWVSKILRLRKEDREKIENDDDDEGQRSDYCSAEEECDDCNDQDDDDEKIEFDKSSFSKLLRRVTLAEARVYAKMSVLGNLAYSIPQIKPGDLLKYHGYRFVTSSLEKKEQALKAEKEKLSAEVQQKENGSSEVPKKTEVLTEVQETEGNPKDKVQANEEKSDENQSSVFAAYRVALSAASYLHSRTTSLLHFKSSKNELSEDLTGGRGTIGDVTSVVAAKEEVKQAVADDLNSSRSSPCDWFICDDDRTATRFFVIQGSESMSSWKANLLFEPIEFEGLDVLVHRGIYEAAKGIFEQMLPEVCDHVRNHGDRALFRFTGHSLGGSLSLLVNLMLLIRGEVPLSSLLPVITFGAPQIMCGGDRLLHKLRLPRSHVQSIAMHRDIVPRAFSCNYPSHIADIFKALNRNFRNHPCLKSEGKLYPPMGEFLILQPGEKFSPPHDLLPAGSGLYILSCPVSDAGEAEKQIQAALSAFLNSPHPLEIVSDRSSYGSQGTIIRDHDMTSYLKSVRNVFRQELRRVMKARREHRRRVWWAHVQFNFAGVLQTGTASLKRLRGLVGSRHMQLLVVLFLPAHMLILGAYSVISSHIGKFL